MDRSDDEEALQDAVRKTVEGNAARVQDWMAGRPGSWGFLAGKAVVKYRQGLGRRLTDVERRRVWRLLWESLLELKRRRLG